MIVDKDRGYYFGASDTDKIIGKWTSKTWLKWWLQKLSINTAHFDNVYTLAGTHFEHRILESLSIPFMELDKQIIIENLRLRVNLDGNTKDCIYEVKTYKYNKDRPFTMPKKYKNQVQVQMFATGIRKAKIVVYGLEEADYQNFFRPIDPDRIKEVDIEYNPDFIENKYLPKLRVLAENLKNGTLPEQQKEVTK